MTNEEIIISRLNVLTTFMNNVRTLSKKIFQLPPSTDGIKWVATYNETSEETEKFNLTDALEGMYSLSNGITAIGNIVRDAADFTFEVGFEWKINGIEYANAEITRTINDAGTGNHRIDIAVCDTNNDIYIIEGFEVPLATAVVQPPTPPNTLFICSFLITESVIGDNTPPQIGEINVIDITYLELVSKISLSELIIGKYYRIIDFQTIHKILGGTDINAGEIEPLIVLALKNNKISSIAFSQTYPSDILHYSITDNTIMSPSSGSKGVITYRKDTIKNLETHYDFRIVVFRRWAINPAPGLYFAYSMYSGINSYVEYRTFGSNCQDISIGSNSYNCIIRDNCYAITIEQNVGTAGAGITINNNCHGINIDKDSCQVTTVGSGYVGGIWIGQDSRYITIGSRSYNIAIGYNCYAIVLGMQNSDINVPSDSMRRRIEKGFSNFECTANINNSDTINLYGVTVSAVDNILYGSAQFCGIVRVTSPNAEENIEVLSALLTSLTFQNIRVIPENGLKLNFIDKTNASNTSKNLNLNGSNVSVDGSKGESIEFFKVMEDTTGSQTSDFYIHSTNVRGSDVTPTLPQVLAQGDEAISDDGLKKIQIDRDSSSVKIYTRPTTGDVWVLKGEYAYNSATITDGTNTNSLESSGVVITNGNAIAEYSINQVQLTDFSQTATLTKDGLIISDGTNETQITKEQFSVSDGTDTTSLYPAKITNNGTDYPLPTGASSPFATVAQIPTINENYKGTYTSLSALETAHPTASSGNYAIVDAGAGNDAIQYIWDAQDGWVSAGTSSLSTTDSLTEGTVNLYFTIARVLATALTGLSLSDGSDVTSANSILVAIGKLQKQLTDVRAAKQDKEIWLSNISPYTLTSTTVLQKAFNIGTNGALDAQVRTYKFEGLISLSSLSSSNGNTSFGFLGTATVASIRYTHVSMKGVLVSTPFSSLVTTAAQTTLTNNNTNTTSYMHVMGIVRISGAGTLIPAVGMSTAAAAVVDANSYFTFTELGTDTATNSTTGTS